MFKIFLAATIAITTGCADFSESVKDSVSSSSELVCGWELNYELVLEDLKPGQCHVAKYNSNAVVMPNYTDPCDVTPGSYVYSPGTKVRVFVPVDFDQKKDSYEIDWQTVECPK